MTLPLAVVSLSGGMDSTALVAHKLQTHSVLALSFNYGQRHVRELKAAHEVARHYGIEHHVVDLRSVGDLLAGSALTDLTVPVPEGHYVEDTMRATVVPNRNAIMANIAVGVASARQACEVTLGVHAGDHAVYPDCRPEFISALRACVNTALEGFDIPLISTPFLHWTKADIARRGSQLDAPLHLSWSCYKGGAKQCGRCGTCVERAEAFHLAGVEDPTEYEDAAFWKEAVGA